MVLVDGQNVFKACRANYEHGYVHPLLLAHRLLDGRELCSVRYYSGVHDPRINPQMNAVTNRRHALMQRLGLTVVHRPLRYRWEWGVNREDSRALPDPEAHPGETRTVRVEPYQQPREKGIDLSLGLDVVDLALSKMMDVAIVVSSDIDLVEVARVTHQMTKAAGYPVSVEAAVFNEEDHPIRLRYYAHTHQLRRDDFEASRDSFNYTKELDPKWREAFVRSCDPYRPAGPPVAVS